MSLAEGPPCSILSLKSDGNGDIDLEEIYAAPQEVHMTLMQIMKVGR